MKKKLIRNSILGVSAVLLAALFFYRSPTQKNIDATFQTIDNMEVVFQDNRVAAAKRYDKQLITITGYSRNMSSEYRSSVSYDGGKTFTGGPFYSVLIARKNNFWNEYKRVVCDTTDDVSKLHTGGVVTVAGNIYIPTGNMHDDLNITTLENCHIIKE